jgi:hypothetical protein
MEELNNISLLPMANLSSSDRPDGCRLYETTGYGGDIRFNEGENLQKHSSLLVMGKEPAAADGVGPISELFSANVSHHKSVSPAKSLCPDVDGEVDHVDKFSSDSEPQISTGHSACAVRLPIPRSPQIAASDDGNSAHCYHCDGILDDALLSIPYPSATSSGAPAPVSDHCEFTKFDGGNGAPHRRLNPQYLHDHDHHDGRTPDNDGEQVTAREGGSGDNGKGNRNHKEEEEKSSWDLWYEALLAFRDAFGHCNVPRSYEIPSDPASAPAYAPAPVPTPTPSLDHTIVDSRQPLLDQQHDPAVISTAANAATTTVTMATGATATTIATTTSLIASNGPVATDVQPTETSSQRFVSEVCITPFRSSFDVVNSSLLSFLFKVSPHPYGFRFPSLVTSGRR